MDNPISWDYLTTVPGTNEVFGPFAILFLTVFGLGFLGAVFFYNDGARRYTNHGLKRRLLRRGAGIALFVFGTGLFFFGIRVLQINPFGFGMRIWLWLSLLAVAAMFAFFLVYLRTTYRGQLLAYEERRIKERYLRPTVPRPATARPASATTAGPRVATAGRQAAGAEAARSPKRRKR